MIQHYQMSLLEQQIHHVSGNITAIVSTSSYRTNICTTLVYSTHVTVPSHTFHIQQVETVHNECD